MKKILITVVWALLVGGIGSLFVFANKKQSNETCRTLKVKIEYQNAETLINESYIVKLITREGIRIKGQPLKHIPIAEIQQLLTKNPYIKKSSVRIGVDCIVNVFVEQRIPLVKVMPAEGVPFYLDTEGAIMPLSPGFPVRVMVASGLIRTRTSVKKEYSAGTHPEPFKMLTPDLQKVYVAASALNKQDFTRALAEQLYINTQGELELIPKIGEQIILLGDTTRLTEKIENLNTFYTRGMDAEGCSNYRSISLKYRNQVICTKTTQNGSI